MDLPVGSAVVLRSLRPQERVGVRNVFGRLSERSRLQRFFAPKPHLTERDLEQLTDVDGERRAAVVAVAPVDEHAATVGIARFVRDSADPDEAEVAFAVADEWQGRGVGTALARELASRARAVGIRRLRASAFADNVRSLALVRGLGPVVDSSREGATVELVVEL